MNTRIPQRLRCIWIWASGFVVLYDPFVGRPSPWYEVKRHVRAGCGRLSGRWIPVRASPESSKASAPHIGWLVASCTIVDDSHALDRKTWTSTTTSCDGSGQPGCCVRWLQVTCHGLPDLPVPSRQLSLRLSAIGAWNGAPVLARYRRISEHRVDHPAGSGGGKPLSQRTRRSSPAAAPPMDAIIVVRRGNAVLWELHRNSDSLRAD